MIIPSISFDKFILREFEGSVFYEERYLYFAYFLKQPKTHVIAVLSEGFEPCIVDYFFDHLAKVTGMDRPELRGRFDILTIPTKKGKSLTEVILNNSEYVKKIKETIEQYNQPAFVEFFQVNVEEIRLAVLLQIPLYGLTDSSLALNSKSEARDVFSKAGLDLIPGEKDIFSLEHAYDVLQKLAKKQKVKNYLLKLNRGGAGHGIVKFSIQNFISFETFKKALKKGIRQDFFIFERACAEQGAVVEVFIDEPIKISPSAQFEILPDHSIRALATHDQILEGLDYVGVKFPADFTYQKFIVDAGLKIVKETRRRGALGIIAVDFLLSRKNAREPWSLWPVEINARKGGTNHTYFWVKYLTEAVYNEKRGILESEQGDIYYKASEAFGRQDWLRRIEPTRLIGQIKMTGLDFNHKKKSGVFMHMISPMKDFGKFGCTVIGHSAVEVEQIWNDFELCIEALRTQN